MNDSQHQSHPSPAEQTQEVWLAGSDRAIGRAHAEQLSAAVSQGMPQFYFNFWQRMVNTPTPSFARRYGMGAARWFLDNVVVKQMHRQVPEWAFERVKGVSEVSGRPLTEMTTALILPDLFPIFQVWLTKWAPKLFIPTEFPPLFGCSSFFSREARFVMGRNLDFPGVSYWDRFPVVQVTAPTNKLRYVAFTSAGIPFGGITGINEDQISVALHQHYSRAGSLSGRLPFLIAEEILMNARSISEAVAYLEKQKVATSWAFLIADGKTKEAVIYECHSQAGALNRLAGRSLSHSNYYQTPVCRRMEFATTSRMNWDNYCRKNRMDQLLDDGRGKLSDEYLVKILADHYDPYWEEEKPFNRTISQVYNIQSLLIDYDAMQVFMAEGNSPIHLREYVKYDLGDLFAGRSGRKNERLKGYRFADEEKGRAKEEFIQSFVHAFDGNYRKAAELLDRSLKEFYTAEAGLIRGALYLKEKDFPHAKEAFEAAIQFIEEKKERLNRDSLPPEYFEILIWLARTWDLLGSYEKSLEIYERVRHHSDCVDSNLKRIARQAKRYRERSLDNILMPYSSYIPFQ